MEILCKSGHGDKVLIADGNYPLVSKSGTATKVFLGLTAGIPSVTDVLRVLQGVINIEKAEVMMPDDNITPEIFTEFKTLLNQMELTTLDRYAFYDACCVPSVILAISSGDQRIYSNILITIGIA
jgi:L-fucose mutarotase